MPDKRSHPTTDVVARGLFIGEMVGGEECKLGIDSLFVATDSRFNRGVHSHEK